MTRLRRVYRLSGSKLFRALRASAARQQNYLCYWCGGLMRTDIPANDPRYLTGDHLIPLYAGGKTKAGNIVASCRKCNSSRHPELNKTREKRHHKSGNDTPHSPFEVLKGRL